MNPEEREDLMEHAPRRNDGNRGGHAGQSPRKRKYNGNLQWMQVPVELVACPVELSLNCRLRQIGGTGVGGRATGSMLAVERIEAELFTDGGNGAVVRLVRTGSPDDDGRVSERRADSAVPGSFSVDRRFRLWRYGVSHQTLMLRSTARFASDDTVDVWFDGVAASKLHHSFQPLKIRAAETGSLRSSRSPAAVSRAGVRWARRLCRLRARPG